MNNKYLFLFAALMFSIVSASAADNVKVNAISSFSTSNPAKTIDVRVVENSAIGLNGLKSDDVLHCNVVKIINPKRGKISASFLVSPVSYTSEGVTIPIEGNYYGKYSTKILSKEEIKNIDAMQVGKKAALTVGNHFVKGVAPAVAMAEGMIKNEDGNRLESGVKQVYKDSAFSYVEKGKELTIESGDSFYFVFKPSKSKNAADIEADADETFEK